MEITFTTIIFLLIFFIGILVSYFIGKKAGHFNRDRYWNDQIPIHRKDAIMKSRAVLSGQFSEQLSPYLPNFPYNPNEARFVGKPVDFIVFRGMDEKDISEIVFVEVKSGDSKLSSQERKVRDAIKSKKVSWEEYRIPKNLTEDKNRYL